jgi:PAS domain-containing protein
MRCDLGDTLNSVRPGFQVIIDEEWRCVYLNPAAEAHGRRNTFELHGRTVFEIYPGIEETVVFERLCCAMIGRVHQQFEILFTFPDGEERWFDIRVEPMCDGISVSSQDIHGRKLQQLAREADNGAWRKYLPIGKRLREAFLGG